MALRPINFSIPSSSELKLSFTENLSPLLSTSNFKVVSLNGAVSDLEVKSLDIVDKVVIIKTAPQVPNNYYLLKLLDTADQVFSSDRGFRLVDDAVSRELFFVGIDAINPILDDILIKLPPIYDIQNTNLKPILSAQAKELYRAQIKIGEVLSDNYISIDVVDERRVRTAGAFDRLGNENAYDIYRVAKKRTGDVSFFKSLRYDGTSEYSYFDFFPDYPVSLQQQLVEQEEISLDTEGNSFDGYLITLKNKNILKIISLLVVTEDDEEDCNGNIGTLYDLSKYKYSIQSNYYDPDNALSFRQLESSQILISEFGNIPRPKVTDKIYVTYLYKNTGIIVNSDSIDFFRIEYEATESVPSSLNRFFLKHAPIVSSTGESVSMNGVSFSLTENSDIVPDEFTTELAFNISKLPSSPGEYAVNYDTGEVYVFGATADGLGTGKTNYIASYYWKKSFKEDIDYSFYNSDIASIDHRDVSGSSAIVEFSYDEVYSKDIDYKLSSHIEVMPESVENRINNYFSIKTLNSPITNVFKILNQTTGEIYNPIHFSDTEIFFSGRRSPEIKEVLTEQASFRRVSNEELQVIGQFINPIFEVKIVSAVTNNAIVFHPPIPAELISYNSDQYFCRTTDVDEEVSVTDLNIIFFGTPDGNNLISSFAIGSGDIPPTLGSKIIIGLNSFVIHLDEVNVLNKNNDALGNVSNSSVEFSDTDIFSNEKYFEPLDVNPGFATATNGKFSLALTVDKKESLYQNLSRMRLVGDYCIDYKNGIAYVAADKTQDSYLGFVGYNCSLHQPSVFNVQNVYAAKKKYNPADDLATKDYVHHSITSNEIGILDIEEGFSKFDETQAATSNGNVSFVAEVLEDYTVVVPNFISSINAIVPVRDLVGEDLNSQNQTIRHPESGASEILAKTIDGGKNINNESIKFFENVIDLKKTVQRRVYDTGLNYEVIINDSMAQTFVSASVTKNEQALFGDDLNITKVAFVSSVSVTDLIGTAEVVLSSQNDLSTIDNVGDYLLDSEGNQFLIIGFDYGLSTITVNVPAINTAEPLPIIDTEDASSIIVKATVSISLGEITVSIPLDAPISDGEMLDIVYLTSDIPYIGTPLFVDYRYGDIYLDYSYVYDQISVWYEWGDNSIDWSIGNAIDEGSEYFVSYRYGALREALKRNFGILTGIPFFKEFSLTTDRELYRNALKGAIQAFPAGPTVSSYKQLIKSFTGISPIVNELSFGNWILGSSYLSPSEVQYSGNLSFKNAKFKEGLYIGSDTKVWMPSCSNISFNEGTFEAWVAPEWGGIWNDASITIDLDHIGQEIISYDARKKLIDCGWEKLELDEFAGRFDDTKNGFTFSNYESIIDSGVPSLSQGRFGVYKSLENLNVAVDFDATIDFNIDFVGNNYASLSDGTELLIDQYYTVLTLGLNDSERFYGVDFFLKQVVSFSYSEEATLDESIDLPDYEPPYPVRPCKCFVEDTVTKLQGFDHLTSTITLPTNFSFLTFKTINNVIDNSAECFVISESNLNFYQVVAFVDDSGVQRTTIPDMISKVIVLRVPMNNQALSSAGYASLNQNFITEETMPMIMHFKGARILSDTLTDSEIFWDTSEYSILNWSDKTSLSISKRLLDNKIDIKIDNYNTTMFWHESKPSFTLNAYTIPDDVSGIVLAETDTNILASTKISKVFCKVYNRFDKDDIWIGKDGYHPKSNKFTVNRFDSKISPIGIHHSSVDGEGVYIGFDEFCTSPVSNEIGQWRFVTRAARAISIPESVLIEDDNYTTNFILHNIDHLFSGNIITSGEFSSVVRASKNSDGLCSDNSCSSSFRFTGTELLEASGWRSIQDSNSDLINTNIGGMDGDYGKWLKIGEFDTLSSLGIYRMGPSSDSVDCATSEVESNVLRTNLSCYNGSFYTTLSMQVASVDSDIPTGSFEGFSGLYTGKYTGISPIIINNGDINVSVSLGMSVSDNVVLILDRESNTVLDMFAFDWNDSLYHEFTLEKDATTNLLTLSIDNTIYSQISTTLFSEVESKIPSYSVALFDSDLVDSALFHSEMDPNQIHIDVLNFNSEYQESEYELESDDIMLHTDDRISFEFNISELDEPDYYEGEDAYDGYDGYGSIPISSDEILFTSDNLKYILDSKSPRGPGRFSIFKDGKGFLNFFISENRLDDQLAPVEYNLSYNAKHFKPNELHHIAASWRLNTVDEKDEMHLFVDGSEVPNIYKFGGKVPVSINDKFSDVSKESLWAFTNRDIEFCEEFFGAITSASSSVFTCTTANFTEDMVGLALVFTDSAILTAQIGKAYFISSVIDSNQVILSDLETQSEVVFEASASDVDFKFFPIAGRISDIMTDFRNEKFSVKRTLSDGTTYEYGGIVYSNSEPITILSGQNISDIKYWANAESRVIQFLEKNSECLWQDSVLTTDTDIHIETYGLTLRRIKQDLQLTSSSYLQDPHPYSGKSLIFSKNISPVDLSDVVITRILLPRTLVPTPPSFVLDVDSDFITTFNFPLDSVEGYNKISSETGLVYNQNLGRKICLNFDSDNVDFSKYDEDETQIQNGSLDTGSNRITVYGTTTDGVDEETFFIRKNGRYEGEKFFKTLTSVSGTFKIVDSSVDEAGVIQIEEVDPIGVSNNAGDYAEVWSYKNGIFEISKVGTSGVIPFELHPGYYRIDYPAHLNIDLAGCGKDLFVGSDYLGKNGFNGVMDELVICSEISTDTRPYEGYSGRRSITEQYNRTKETCPSENVLSLIHFNDPVREQVRRLRNYYFLDTENNYKYNLSTSQIEDLVPYFNTPSEFISYLVSIGISQEESERVYYEVHSAGGVIVNEALRMNNYHYLSSASSVNDYFGNSAAFYGGKFLSVENNKGQFRAKEGSIEFWVSPDIDTSIDSEIRYYVDVYSAKQISVKSTTSTKIELPNSARKVLSVTLISKTQEYLDFYIEKENVLFDQINRGEVSGRLEGGSGYMKNFFDVNGSLSADGKTILLADALPGQNIDVIVTYVPIEYSGDRFSIFKDENSMLNFLITAGGVDNYVNIPIDWRRNSWHKVLVNYKTGSKNDIMKIFVDGVEGGIVRFGEGIIMGTGFVYGQTVQTNGQSRNSYYTMSIKDDLRTMAIGANVFGDFSSRSRMDNVRFSRTMRVTPRDGSGLLYDPNWSANLNTVRPMISDDSTTALFDFDTDGSEITSFAIAKDPVNGIFDFKIGVIDEFGRIPDDNGKTEDLITNLVNRLKPAHTRAYVDFLKNHC